MTFVEAMILLIGLALVLLGFCGLVIWLEKKVPIKGYDERQKEVQGKAYKWAFNTGVIYFAAVMLVDMLLPLGIPMDMSFLIYIGLALQGFVFVAYCSLCCAYFPLRRSPKWSIILMYTAGILNLIDGANHVRLLGIHLDENGLEIIKFPDVRLRATGVDVAAWLKLILAVMFIVLATVQLISYKREQASHE